MQSVCEPDQAGEFLALGIRRFKPELALGPDYLYLAACIRRRFIGDREP